MIFIVCVCVHAYSCMFERARCDSVCKVKFFIQLFFFGMLSSAALIVDHG